MEMRVLAVGDFGPQRRSALETIAGDAAAELESATDVDSAKRALSDTGVDAILVDAQSEGMGDFCVGLRGQALYSQLPVIAICPDLDDLVFEETYGWGCDDAVSEGNTRGLVCRLRTFSKCRDTLPPPSDRGPALIVDGRDEGRIVLGRVLRNAGFSVTFARSAEDADSYLRTRQFSLVVENAELVPGQREVITQAQSRGFGGTWIVQCAPRQMSDMQASLAGLANVAVAEAFAPAENVLFVANELASGTKNQRATPRMLYRTTVRFRAAGHEWDDAGFTYNVSEGGLYVRTLMPPGEDRVWLELRPPRTDRLVRLEGRVAWRRGVGPVDNATVPPGFGVSVLDGSQADLEAWSDGCRRFQLPVSG